MKSPLNSPLEVGVRVLMMLTETYPEALDINRLVLLDHSVLHTADLGGPSSIHPPLPARAGELGVRRKVIEEGLQVMLRAELISLAATDTGIRFQAGDSAYGFVRILTASYAAELRERTKWVVHHFQDLPEDMVRSQMREIFGSWSEEFNNTGPAIDDRRPW
ncbi:ABC-three component system middle component 2 [Saccharopolyspora sp. NPDC003762]